MATEKLPFISGRNIFKPLFFPHCHVGFRGGVPFISLNLLLLEGDDYEAALNPRSSKSKLYTIYPEKFRRDPTNKGNLPPKHSFFLGVCAVRFWGGMYIDLNTVRLPQLLVWSHSLP